ncbi:EIF2D factor, partial [Crocuta crocuta]
VYTLWSCPDLLPVFTTWPLVLEKLVGGADLMLPGLVVPPAGLPQVQKGDLCAIALLGNRYCASPLCLWGEIFGKTGEAFGR